MKSGKCPRCNGTDVYHKINGVISGDKKIYVRISMLSPATDKETFVCSSCGYYENYIIDKSILNKVKEKWAKV